MGVKQIVIEVSDAGQAALDIEKLHQGLNASTLFNRAIQLYGYLNTERRDGWEVVLLRRRGWWRTEQVVVRWNDRDEGDVRIEDA